LSNISKFLLEGFIFRSARRRFSVKFGDRGEASAVLGLQVSDGPGIPVGDAGVLVSLA
jgi:hypothetical protein